MIIKMKGHLSRRISVDYKQRHNLYSKIAVQKCISSKKEAFLVSFPQNFFNITLLV